MQIDLRELDASYRPFPSFSDWSSLHVEPVLSVMPTGGTGPYAIDVNAPPGQTFTMAGNRLNLTDGSSVPYSWHDPVPITVTITDVAGSARVQALELLGLVLC